MDSFIDVDCVVKDVDWVKVGIEVGLEMLELFCDSRFKYFVIDRNNFIKEVLSNLLLWFYVGN